MASFLYLPHPLQFSRQEITFATAPTDGDSITVTYNTEPTYEEYPYRADLTCQGVTATDVINVYFDYAEIYSGKYCVKGTQSANTVSIYSSEIPESAIIIPAIVAEVVSNG